MSYCLESKASDCRNCYKCIRYCPMKAISFANNKAAIIHDECILCGRCYLMCPQNSKIVRNDVLMVQKIIHSKRKVIVSLAPSFVANFNANFADVKKAILKLGFSDVEETAVGATIVKKRYDEMLDEKHDVIISSCCHSINLLIQKHYPKALPFLADAYSPMVAHGKDIKSRYGVDAAVVFVGPCIAKKDEGERNADHIDAVLTFGELEEWLKEEKIVIDCSKPFHRDEESKARLFPICGGILETMKKENKDYHYIAVDGVEHAKKVLQDIIDGKIHKCFIEMSACHGSCVNGPMMKNNKSSLVSRYINVENIAGEKDFTIGKLNSQEIIHPYYAISLAKLATPSEKEIIKVLRTMGKTSKSDELNCGSCGYTSCREKATAVIQGRATIEMCLPYLMEKAQSFSEKIVMNSPNGLMVLDESLNIQLLNNSMCKIIGISAPSVLIKKNVTTILDPTDYALALGDNSDRTIAKKVYLSEYEKYVENTIIYDRKFHILICVMKDITDRELQAQKRDELIKKSVEITNKVIEKNMRSVQEIASLLGESTAETKVALLSLKDALNNDK